MPSLTVRKVQSLKEPGMHGDGGGLYLRIGKAGVSLGYLGPSYTEKEETLGWGPPRWSGWPRPES